MDRSVNFLRTILATALLCGVCLLSGGCPSGDEPETTSVREQAETNGAKQPPGEPPPLPEFPAATCRVYTDEPGYAVFVDGLPVRDESGEFVRTPCAVTAAPGTHSVTVAREGARDLTKTVAFSDDSEAVFDDRTTDGEPSALLNAPLLNAAVGEPVALTAVNSPRAELDPFVSADGRSLWFVSDRLAGRGIYVATRSGPLQQFGEPRLLDMTRGADLPASPSVTIDGTRVFYVVPDKTRIWSLSRSNPLADFAERTPIFFRNVPNSRWTSCQVVGKGLRAYFARESGADPIDYQTRVIIRESLEEEFAKELVFPMPGLHPCLSSDGLRQYAFDGKTLTRSRRESVRSAFAAAETIAELTLNNYAATRSRRQYWVSEDEQWLYYCDDPEAGGDLFVVRLAPKRGWGVALRGEPIEERVVAEARPPVRREGMPADEPAPEETVDPKTLPLSYTRLRDELSALVAAREFDALLPRVEAAQKDQELEQAVELLRWDADDARRLAEFGSALMRALEMLEPGDPFRIGSLRLEFVGFENGVLTGTTGTREVERPLSELDTLTLVNLANGALDDADEADHLRAATFLAYDPDGPPTILRDRIDDAGEAGDEFMERLARRLVRQAEWELARDALPRALEFINRTSEEFPDSAAAGAAEEIREQLYSRYTWQRRGNREWTTGPLGEFTASSDRAENAVLMSPQEYARFELTMEYRTNGANGQGGVFFRYPGSGPLYGNCFKIQLSNDEGVNADEYCTGALFGIEAPQVNAAGAGGEWQTFRMVVDGEKLDVWINDRQVLDTTAIDDQIPESGYIALDGIPGGISYRKVLVVGEGP